MGDIYIHRGDYPTHRRRGLIGTILVLLAVAAGVWAYFKYLAPAKPSVTPPEATPPDLSVAPAGPAAPVEPAAAAAPASPTPTVTAPVAAQTASPSGPDPALDRLPGIRAQVEADDLAGARAAAFQALETATSVEGRKALEAILGDVNTKLLYSRRPMEEKTAYTVAAGDSLARIASRNNTTIELIQKINGLRGAGIQAGRDLQVFTGTFRVIVDKSDNELRLLCNGKFFKAYPVGTGKWNSTPVGDTVITDRIPQPTWYAPDGREIRFGDPANLLGTHWLALDIPHYGIHGTWDETSIGKQSSEGCIRLKNADIEELFNLLPIGTTVTIQD